VAKHVGVGPDNFSLWHRCRRWTERGLSCPFRGLEEEPSEPEGDAEGKTASGAASLQAAVGSQLGVRDTPGFAELLGPLLALFTVLRGVQTLGKAGLQMGRVQAAGLSEEATVRILRPEVPAREGPTPAKPGRSRPGPVSPQRIRGGSTGFFANQAAELKVMLGRR